MSAKLGNQHALRHGCTGTPEYNIWQSMLRRCLSPRAHDWKYYGGRGITVCHQWQQSFETFLADIGNRPAPHLTLDRIDNDGDYEPSNVRWTTRQVQAANRRLPHKIV